MNYALCEFFTGIRVQPLRRVQIFREMRSLELRIAGFAQVILRKLPVRSHCAAQQSAADGAVSKRGDAVLASIRQNVGLNFTFEKIVGRLHRVKRRNSSE